MATLYNLVMIGVQQVTKTARDIKDYLLGNYAIKKQEHLERLENERNLGAVLEDICKLHGGEIPNLTITNPVNYFDNSTDYSNSLPGL